LVNDRVFDTAVRFVVACVLLVTTAGQPRVAAQGGLGRQNTWAARSSSGVTLGGTWTAVTDPKSDTVTGAWTLDEPNGRTVARGAWSAAKSETGWMGSWRAAVSGRQGEYSGTWSTRVDLKPDARFADLFAKAVEAAVSGNWRAARQSGTWSIRASSAPAVR
jgi:hypothetical protein